jgi:hypothetical protein
MWGAWAAFALVQIITNRYMKHYWRQSQFIHRSSGILITIATLFYGIYGIWKLKKVTPDIHAPMGIFTTFVVLFLAISGLVAQSRLLSGTSNSAALLRYKNFHKVSLSINYNALFRVLAD